MSPRRSSRTNKTKPRLTRSAANSLASTVNGVARSKRVHSSIPGEVLSRRARKPASKRFSRKVRGLDEVADGADHDGQKDSARAQSKVNSPRKKANASGPAPSGDLSDDGSDGDGPQYWLMKAEPESRIEKGKDVKFSIDDLRKATLPEPWDGVRNPIARNNMRTMLKGDLAFFYHSNCKKPGIVGTMEIVQEHSVDESAFDSNHPYFDEKSDREKPKWCVVHVTFRSRFPEMISLKELQRYSKEGGTLEHLQTLNQKRLSVSKVSKKEWDFIMSLVDVDDDMTAENNAAPPNVVDDDKHSTPPKK